MKIQFDAFELFDWCIDIFGRTNGLRRIIQLLEMEEEVPRQKELAMSELDKHKTVGPGLVMQGPPTVDEAIERLPRVKELKAERDQLRAELALYTNKDAWREDANAYTKRRIEDAS